MRLRLERLAAENRVKVERPQMKNQAFDTNFTKDAKRHETVFKKIKSSLRICVFS